MLAWSVLANEAPLVKLFSMQYPSILLRHCPTAAESGLWWWPILL
jgi:hypothetical protein